MDKNHDDTLAKLKKIKIKYDISGIGSSKTAIARELWEARGSWFRVGELNLISKFLEPNDQRDIKSFLNMTKNVKTDKWMIKEEKEEKERKKTITLDKLKKIKKKYNVSVSGSKKEMARGLWKAHGILIETKDLEAIINLLSKKQRIAVVKLYDEREYYPISNYEGMWMPSPKPIKSMTRDELIKNLRKFRNAWEKITSISQNLDNDRLKNKTTGELRNIIKFYYSVHGKLLAEDWLRKKIKLSIEERILADQQINKKRA